ncbi:MAG: aldose 1-epimerase family protein [Candidatus Hydrogenedentes bacterium]|nr:aldose 1-epimerase family protein [Candidatus Hydrogenedentota bacterium]
MSNHWLNISERELKRYVGRLDQLAGIQSYVLQDGKAWGSRCASVYTGSGLEFTVYLDRCMDISHARYKGIPLGWRSTPGDVAPFYYEPEGIRWLRSYFGGLLTTCGLTNVGPPCEKSELNGDGLPGRISNTPGEDVCIEKRWVNERYELVLRGKMRQSALFMENLVLEREIKTYLGANAIWIRDKVVNDGFRKSPFMILYHINIGWPVVSENAKVCIPAIKTVPRDEVGSMAPDPWYEITPPAEGYSERVYFHTLDNSLDETIIGIYQSHTTEEIERNFHGVYVKYSPKKLPKLVQWKMLGVGEYVIGLEPSNAGVLGRDETERRGEMDYLYPGEIRTFELEIGIIDDGVAESYFRSFVEHF